MSRQHNPSHLMRDDVLPSLGMNVADTAQALGPPLPTRSCFLCVFRSPEHVVRFDLTIPSVAMTGRRHPISAPL